MQGRSISNRHQGQAEDVMVLYRLAYFMPTQPVDGFPSTSMVVGTVEGGFDLISVFKSYLLLTIAITCMRHSLLHSIKSKKGQLCFVDGMWMHYFW